MITLLPMSKKIKNYLLLIIFSVLWKWASPRSIAYQGWFELDGFGFTSTILLAWNWCALAASCHRSFGSPSSLPLSAESSIPTPSHRHFPGIHRHPLSPSSYLLVLLSCSSLPGRSVMGRMVGETSMTLVSLFQVQLSLWSSFPEFKVSLRW